MYIYIYIYTYLNFLPPSPIDEAVSVAALQERETQAAKEGKKMPSIPLPPPASSPPEPTPP
jgi:hypothetical protein